jgi:aspartate 1-decarboxylase
MDEKEARSFTPKVVMLGEGNQPLKSRGTEKEREVAD